MLVKGNDVQGHRLSEQVERKVLAHSGSLMLVEFRFAKGGVGQPHCHADHEQIGYIVEGAFEVTVGDRKRVLCRGDCYYAGRNVMHGVVAMEDGMIVDAFTPIRKDFLND